MPVSRVAYSHSGSILNTALLIMCHVSQPGEVTSGVSRGEEDPDREAMAWGPRDQRQMSAEVDEPVYINVAGHFACLLLDDDSPVPSFNVRNQPHPSVPRDVICCLR